MSLPSMKRAAISLFEEAQERDPVETGETQSCKSFLLERRLRNRDHALFVYLGRVSSEDKKRVHFRQTRSQREHIFMILNRPRRE